MKYNLIFDLDGTLWSTVASYYYAFKKYFFAHPELKQFTDEKNISVFKGITMDKMAKYLFPTLSKEKQIESMKECLFYSCEYLKENECINKEIISQIKNLSIENNLYMVSNCPNEYIDIFFNKSGLYPYFKDVINLGGFTKTSDFDKGENILKLINKHNLNRNETFFIGDSNLDLESCKYANINYIYFTCDLLNLEERIKERIENQKILDLCDYYEEFRCNDASVILLINNKQKEYKHLFGFLNFSSDFNNNKNVFEQLELKAKKLNIKSLVGPIDFCTWFDYRLPIDNFDTKFIPDINGKKEDVETLSKLGYNYLYTYASTVSTINQKLMHLSSKITLDQSLYDELIVGGNVFNYIEEIFDLSKECFKDAYLYSDVPFDKFNDIYVKWLKNLPFDIDLYMLRKKESSILVAYGICYYDYINNLYVCKTIGIKQQYQNSKIVMHLAKIVFERANYHKASKILYHFQNEQKNTLSAFWRNNVVLKKRYAMFIKNI